MKTKRLKLECDATGCPTNLASWVEDNIDRIVGTTHRGYWSIIRRCEKDLAQVPDEKTRRWAIYQIRQAHFVHQILEAKRRRGDEQNQTGKCE